MEQIEDGQTIELFGEEFTLDLVETFSINEWTINVFHEQSDDELSDVQDHFTVEVVECGEVTSQRNNLSSHSLIKHIFSELGDLHL